MSLTRPDVERIAKLARLELDAAELEQTQKQLNAVLGIFNTLQQAEVGNLKPLTHPTSTQLRLRDDVVSEPNRREDYQALAPETEKGLYLVPKVIE
jgi:aspartyl-tRNA(Asn)/glutamyl-tRNA(Gln) amidotransferase subunit C